jgi:hypothetical protein
LAAPNPDGESYVFQTDNEVRSDAATKTTTVTALEVGAAANGCLGVCELIDVIDGVASVTMTLAAGAGADEEDADAYLDRLADALTILAPRPILPQDHATMARQIEGVGRALAIDLYKPGTNDNIAAGQPGGPLTVEGVPLNAGAGTTNVPRCVSVAITAENGQPPSQALMHEVWLTLDGAREVNFLEYVVPPTLYDDRGPSDGRRLSRLRPRGSPSGSRRNDANVARPERLGSRGSRRGTGLVTTDERASL